MAGADEKRRVSIILLFRSVEVDMPKIIVYCIVATLGLSGCAGYNHELLGRDYTQMTDQELLTYSYELSSAIDRCANDPGRVTVGLGTGFGLRNLGVWMGLSRGVAPCDPQELIRRQAEVRLELQRRGLSP
ncbi:MAG TPA: hypothetical protein PLJ30_08525 [Deltaproteobacteria bacterium]|jgi:hypothetical protein|nr:hypothetical protein [Bacteriovoracaceae bacterium]HPA84839.1 hypothetical protein [Deltaproteobacteria bacterium]HQQ15777.1 hypothetical protein [Deltaproteobacteria bacterium]